MEHRLNDTGIKSPSRKHDIFGHAILRFNPVSFFFLDTEKQLGYSGIYCLRMFFRTLIIVSDPQLARDVMVRRNLPKDKYEPIRPLVGDSILTMSGKPWYEKRKKLNPAFSPTFLKENVAPVMFEHVHELVRQLEPYTVTGLPCDIHEWLSKVTMDIIGEAGFGHNFGFVTGKSLDSISRMVVTVLNVPNLWTLDPLRKFTHPLETIDFYLQLAKFKKMGRQIIERAIRGSDEALNASDPAQTPTAKRTDILALLMKEFREEGPKAYSAKTVESLMNEIITFLCVNGVAQLSGN